MKKIENKKSYLAPQLTAVSFKSERGFAASGGEFSTFVVWGQSSNDESERMGLRSGWGDNSNNSFWGN